MRTSKFTSTACSRPRQSGYAHSLRAGRDPTRRRVRLLKPGATSSSLSTAIKRAEGRGSTSGWSTLLISRPRIDDHVFAFFSECHHAAHLPSNPKNPPSLSRYWTGTGCSRGGMPGLRRAYERERANDHPAHDRESSQDASQLKPGGVVIEGDGLMAGRGSGITPGRGFPRISAGLAIDTCRPARHIGVCDHEKGRGSLCSRSKRGGPGRARPTSRQ